MKFVLIFILMPCLCYAFDPPIYRTLDKTNLDSLLKIGAIKPKLYFYFTKDSLKVQINSTMHLSRIIKVRKNVNHKKFNTYSLRIDNFDDNSFLTISEFLLKSVSGDTLFVTAQAQRFDTKSLAHIEKGQYINIHFLKDDIKGVLIWKTLKIKSRFIALTVGLIIGTYVLWTY